ncbi:911_t:CDS:2, partial [Scutellospora calospora]
HIAATAVVCDETVLTYEWILEQTKLATGNLQPKTIFTDADPAMQVAISNQYPETIVQHLISDFDHHWMELMNKYSEVQGYCDRVLYLTKECWAHAFTKQCFSANTYSTQCVESINWVIKLEANSGNSLCQLQIRIELQLKDEAKYASFQEFRNMNPTTSLPHIS